MQEGSGPSVDTERMEAKLGKPVDGWRLRVRVLCICWGFVGSCIFVSGGDPDLIAFNYRRGPASAGQWGAPGDVLSLAPFRWEFAFSVALSAWSAPLLPVGSSTAGQKADS